MAKKVQTVATAASTKTVPSAPTPSPAKGQAKEQAKGGNGKGNGKKGKDKKQTAPVREVVYPELEVKGYTEDLLGALTAERASEYLGWEVEEEKGSFGDEYLLTDLIGNRVRCRNNTHNRPFSEQWCHQLLADILHRRFRLNGETIIIGRTGLVLSGQHRLIALVLAQQEANKEGDLWKEEWPDGNVFIETLVVEGVSEDQATVRTLDNVKPRTLSDVLFTDEEMWRDLPTKARKEITKIAEFAIRLVMYRTGARKVLGAMRTHGEAIDFLNRHPRIKEAVSHIYRADEKGISQLISPGYAAGMMYLMGMSASDRDTYLGPDLIGEERHCDDSLWEKAKQFWADIGKQVDEFQELRMAQRPNPVYDPDADEGTISYGKYMGYIFPNKGSADRAGSVTEKLAWIINAWNLYKEDRPLTADEYPDGIVPAYIMPGDSNVAIPEESPVVGGIDHPEGADAERHQPATATGETYEETKERVKREGLDATLDVNRKAKKEEAKRRRQETEAGESEEEVEELEEQEEILEQEESGEDDFPSDGDEEVVEEEETAET